MDETQQMLLELLEDMTTGEPLSAVLPTKMLPNRGTFTSQTAATRSKPIEICVADLSPNRGAPVFHGQNRVKIKVAQFRGLAAVLATLIVSFELDETIIICILFI